MKEFSIPVKITLDCYLSVKANNQDEAYEIADDTMYWAYQNGAPEQHKDLLDGKAVLLHLQATEVVKDLLKILNAIAT